MDAPAADELRSFWFEAAWRGDAEALAALVRGGFHVEQTDARGHSALMLASYYGHEDATRLLLNAGATPDGTGDGQTALMGAAFKGFPAIAEALIAAGADPNRADAAGRTALMLAAEYGRAEVVDLLLSSGADAGRTDTSGATAASLARAAGNGALAERLA